MILYVAHFLYFTKLFFRTFCTLLYYKHEVSVSFHAHDCHISCPMCNNPANLRTRYICMCMYVLSLLNTSLSISVYFEITFLLNKGPFFNPAGLQIIYCQVSHFQSNILWRQTLLSRVKVIKIKWHWIKPSK